MQNFLRKISFVLALTALFYINTVNGQELEATVDVDVAALNPDVKDRLLNFKVDIENYLNKTKFSDQNIVNDIKGKPYKIKCTFSFFFKGSTGFDSYDAQVVVTAQRFIYRTPNYSLMFRVKDESWSFNYTRGQNMYHDDLRFNNLTSFLDYYAYMIIGTDDDTWESGLGTQRFQKAQNIVNLAIANGGGGGGWTDNSVLKQSRNVYPSELLNSKYDIFRKAVWIYHFSGMDSLQWNKREALERIAESIEMIGKVKKTEVRSWVIKAFFEAKFMEIATTLVDHYDKSIYRKLMDIDPDHSSTYEEWARK